MRTIRVIIGVIISALVAVSFASNLMQAQVPVTDHSPISLKKVLPQALAEVLVKLSGNADVMTLPAIQGDVSHVSDIVEAYTYSMVAPNAASAPELMADITFDKKAITQLLSNAGQPVWGASRPVTLVWLDMVSQENQVAFVDSTSATTAPLAVAMTIDAKARGLGLMFPMMDLTDQTDVGDDPADIFNDHHLSGASTRYGTPSILAGKVIHLGGQWTAHWKYVLDGAPIEWDDSAQSPSILAQNAINAVANSMISQLAMANPSALSNTIVLQVSGISDLGQYASVQKYLTSLTPINSVSLQGVDATGMMLEVNYNGGEPQLKQAIISKPLMSVDTAAMVNVTNTAPEVLAYHWQGVATNG